MDSRGPMAQGGAHSTREHRSHPSRLFAQPIVANRIDTSIETMEAPALCPLRNRALRQSDLDELRGRDDPMLPACDPSDEPIHRGALFNHEDTKAPRGSVSPPLRAEDGLQLR